MWTSPVSIEPPEAQTQDMTSFWIPGRRQGAGHPRGAGRIGHEGRHRRAGAGDDGTQRPGGLGDADDLGELGAQGDGRPLEVVVQRRRQGAGVAGAQRGGHLLGHVGGRGPAPGRGGGELVEAAEDGGGGQAAPGGEGEDPQIL